MTINDFLFLAQESATGGAAGTEGAPPNPIMQFAPIILMFVIFYFILIRPQQKRQKELRAQVEAMESGDRAITSGGIHGLVTNIKDTTVTLKVADNVKIEFEKAAIQSVIKKSSTPSDS